MANFKTLSGRCWVDEKVIEINELYEDSRLGQELRFLLVHELLHFVWIGHPKPFVEFLRNIGIPENYTHARGIPSPLYLAVEAERRRPRYRQQCGHCSAVSYTSRLI
jgi:hypothetical protein